MRKNVLLHALSLVICFLSPAFINGQQPKTPPDATSANAAVRDMTLREFRHIYLNQRILILKGQDAGRGSLGGWQPVKVGKDGSFMDDYEKGAFIDFKYKDQTPKILAIRETVGGLETPKEGQKNAMGETVTDDDIVNPSVEVFVQFDDGQQAKYMSIVSLITDRSVNNVDQDPDHWDMEFMLVSSRDDHAKIIAENLPSTIGKQVYAIHDSLLFGPDITPLDLLDLGSRETKRVRDVPLLIPMTIVAAKYNDRYDFIVWKLRLNNGREIMTASRYRDENISRNGNDNSFLGRSISTLLLKVPSNLTAQEIAAISDRKIFRGMSRQAVIYSWGSASENDYGKGGKQLVYGDNQFVYLDSNRKVTDWQSIDR